MDTVLWIQFSIFEIAQFQLIGRCRSIFKSIIFKLIIQNSSLATPREIVLRRKSQNLTNK